VLYDELEERGLSATSIEKVHHVLRIAFCRAVKLGYILRAPTEVATRPRAEYVERVTLSAEQAALFLDHTAGDRTYALWCVFLMQGLRLGETLGVRWEDLDLDPRRLHMRRTVQRLRGQRIVSGTPKTARSRRALDLVPRTVAALKGTVQPNFRSA
jgi:integrase